MKTSQIFVMLQVALLVFSMFLTSTEGAPLFDLFFGGYSGSRGRSSGRQSRSRGEAPGDDYKRICKTVNPDPYAFPGGASFPAAPFCPP